MTQWKKIFRCARKSRAGKSLERYLSALFDAEELVFEEQIVMVQPSINTLGGFINIVRAKQGRMPRHFTINLNFNGPVGQVIEHAERVETIKQ